MKKIFTLFLLVLFLLNAVGLYGIFIGLQIRYAQEANDYLNDEEVIVKDALTLKIPLTLPYAMDQQYYERVSGEFEHEGDVYRLYKQKLYRDTLYIVCVKDANSKKINQALNDYVKTFTDNPVSTKQQSKPIPIKDYLLAVTCIECQSHGWDLSIGQSDFSHNLCSCHGNKIKYPPKSLSVI